LPVSFPYYVNDLKEYNEKEKKRGKITIDIDQIDKNLKNYEPLGG